MRTQYTLVAFLAACQPSPLLTTGFGSTPDITSTSDSASTADSTSISTSTGAGSTSSAGTSTGSDGEFGGSTADTMAKPIRDLGAMPDFGGGSPVGCAGKIDFLFMISRQQLMKDRQKQLATAFPQFIATIKSKFADFDYHIMVVAGDDGWGNEMCTDLCPTVDCKVGDACCTWFDPDWVGEQCCDLTYPCQDLDLVTQCDRTWGAGEVFPAGVDGEANKPCPIDGDLRYLVKGQSNLEDTFECIANVGTSGYMLLGQALTAAVQKPINDPGGCNRGFLRDDALLMVTFVAANPDSPGLLGSEGTTAQWAQAVIDAKNGDAESAVMLNIGGCKCAPQGSECHPDDRLCVLTTMFPYHHLEVGWAADYGPAFTQAVSLVETACAAFMPPG